MNPPSMAKSDLSSTFGKCEMEWAADVIVGRSQDKGEWVNISISDFLSIVDTDDILDGLGLLMGYGWLEFDANEECWKVSEEFVEKVTDDGS